MKKITFGKVLRYVIFWGLVAAFIWLIISRFTEIRNIVQTILSGKLWLVAIAFCLQLGVFFIMSKLYQAGFVLVGVKFRLREILPLLFAGIFANVAAPMGGTTGMILFVDEAERRGKSGPKVMAGAILSLVAIYCASSVVLVVGMVYLFMQSELKGYEIAAAGGMFLIILLLTVLLLVGLWKPKWLFRFFQWVEHAVNKVTSIFSKKQVLPNNWAETYAEEFTAAAQAIMAAPGQVFRMLWFAVLVQVLSLAELYVLFVAFGYFVQFGPMVAGYAMGMLFGTVSPAPQGIGVVEGVMALIYTSLEIPTAIGAVVSLSFRAFSFWLPIGLGFILLRRLKLFSENK